MKEEKIDGFRVITIGISGPPIDMVNPDRTWPATVIQFQDKYFLVDCGGGATHGLVKAGVHPALVKNVLFTHHHADHDSDYFTFAIGGWNGPQGRRELNLVGPEDTEKLHKMMLDYYAEDLNYRVNYGFPPEGMFKNVNIREVTEKSEKFQVDGVDITTVDGIHTIRNLVYKLEAGGQSVVITGDSALSEEIITLAEGADMLIIDGHLAVGDFSKRVLSSAAQVDNMRKAHMTNEDVAVTASRAKVKKLLLTHLPPLYVDVEATIQEIKDAGYQGEILLAETGKSYFLD